MVVVMVVVISWYFVINNLFSFTYIFFNTLYNIFVQSVCYYNSRPAPCATNCGTVSSKFNLHPNRSITIFSLYNSLCECSCECACVCACMCMYVHVHEG